MSKDEDKLTKYLIGIIVLLIIAIIIIVITKTITKNKEELDCTECEACEKYEPYQEYLNNLKKREAWKFAKITNITFIAHDNNNLYVIPEKNSSLYNSLKDKFVDIPAYCGLEECKQGAIVTDKKIVDLFQVKQGKENIIFVLDEEGNLFYLKLNKKSIELEEVNDYKKVINIYNPDDSYTIIIVDIEGNNYYLNLDNLS